jgi:hypothetical protein
MSAYVNGLARENEFIFVKKKAILVTGREGP